MSGIRPLRVKGVSVKVCDIRYIDPNMEMGNRTLEGKIVVFKTIAVSKIVFQPFITTVPNTVGFSLEKLYS